MKKPENPARDFLSSGFIIVLYLAVLCLPAGDPQNNLALLKVGGQDHPFLTLRAENKIEKGDRIVIVGSPLGSSATLSGGTVSVVHEIIGAIQLLR